MARKVKIKVKDLVTLYQSACDLQTAAEALGIFDKNLKKALIAAAESLMEGLAFDV